MYTGPKLTNDNLVFGFDTGYNDSGKQLANDRYFKGPAHTNLLEEIDPSYTNSTGANFTAVSGAEDVEIPIVGKRTVKYVDYFNNYPTSGNCCPNLFHYHASDGKIYVDSSTSYTYSIVYKHSNNYTHPNFMYRYEYQSNGTYNTEAGFHSTASDRRTHLGNGWYHAWGSFTTQSTTAYVVCYSFLYNYGTIKYRYSVAAVSLVKNVTGQTHFIIPPQLMLEPLGSVSTTTSLIDLTKSTDLTLSAMTYSLTGQPDYDGTNDYINLGDYAPIKLGNSFTIECVVKPEQDKWMYFFHKGYGSNNSLAWGRHSSGDDWFFSTMIGGSYQNSYMGTATLNKYCHLVATYDGANLRLYENGVLKVTSAKTHDMLTSSASAGIGGPDRYWNGKIPVTKIYSKVLTTGEVVSNFNTYKNRFNI